LVVSGITTGTSAFQAGRSSLVLAPGASDTVGVTFTPGSAVAYSDALTLTSNGYNAPTWLVPLYGSGMDTVAVDLASPDGGEQWRYGTAQKIEWASALVEAVDLAYRTGPKEPWIAIADSVADGPKSYVWVIPNAPSAACEVRVREHGGGVEDVSKQVFQITVPGYAAVSALDVGTTSVNVVRGVGLEVANGGTGPLTITGVSSSDGQFWPGRTTLVVPAGGADTVGVYYRPSGSGYHATTLTIEADDPGSPHVVEVTGRAVLNVGVEGGVVPAAFALWQNRPNPFTGRTQIRYALPQGARVSLEVYNLKGERVAVLVDGEQGPGEYSVSFGAGAAGAGGRGGTLPAGIYFYRFRAGPYSATHRMVLMK
jgi:hypothetical protein